MSRVSSGFLVSGCLRASPSASARVRTPTLPAYIKRMSMIFDAVPSTGVRDRLRPTVPIAETTSNSTLLKGATGSGSMAQMMRGGGHHEDEEGGKNGQGLADE